MAQKVSVQLVCDLHDDQDVEAAETAAFGVDGASYELELCEEHGHQLRAAAAPFVAAGRRTAGGSRSAQSRTKPITLARATARTGSTSKGAQTGAREWARAHGYTVSERGRLSAEVMAAFEAAQ